MPIASSSRTNLRSAVEATFGSVTAATGRRRIRNTGSSFKYSLAFTKSNEIRADRQTSDHILLGAAGAGSMNIEMIYREYDAYLAAAMQNPYVAFNTTGVSPTLTSPTFTANTLTQTGGTSFATLAKGQWISIAGNTGGTVANNRVLQVSLSVPATATVITFEGTPALVAGAATGVVTISGSRLVNGVTMPTFAMEVEYADVTQFQTFLGQAVNKFSLALSSKAIATGSVDFMGVGGLPLSTTSNLPGTDDVLYPSAYDVLNCSSNVTSILEANAALTAGTFVKTLSFDIDNALATQDAIQNLNGVGIRANRLNVSGKMGVYFANTAIYNKFFQNSTSSLSAQVKDAAGNGYVFNFPAIEYTDAGLQVGALDQDIMVDITFAAKIDPLTGSMVTIDRFGV